ncbi:MAG: site-specific integrase [Planctomycetes bacterium]|nr:site-specific integrase [Planctomycetota bacterium]
MKEDEIRTIRDHLDVPWETFVDEDLASLQKNRAAGTFCLTERVYRYFAELCQPHFLTEINTKMVEQYRQQRLFEGVKSTTINSELRTLSAGFGRAVSRGLISLNPLYGKRSQIFARESEPIIRTIEKQQFDRLLQACPTEAWKGISLMAYRAGLRQGEILWLQWADLDFKRLFIWVRCKEEHRTKSGRNRGIPMDKELKRFLWRYRINQKGKPDDLVFSSTSLVPNRHRRLKNVSAAFTQIVKMAGLVDSSGQHRFCMHDLRKTCITEWLTCGMSPVDARDLAGHTSFLTTLRYYGAVQIAKQAEFVNKRNCNYGY